MIERLRVYGGMFLALLGEAAARTLSSVRPFVVLLTRTTPMGISNDISTVCVILCSLTSLITSLGLRHYISVNLISTCTPQGRRHLQIVSASVREILSQICSLLHDHRFNFSVLHHVEDMSPDSGLICAFPCPSKNSAYMTFVPFKTG